MLVKGVLARGGGGGGVKRELSNKPFLSVYLSVCQYARKKSSFHSAELRNSSHVSAFYLLKYVWVVSKSEGKYYQPIGKLCRI